MRKITYIAATALALMVGPAQVCPTASDWLSPSSALAQDEDPEITRMAKEHYRLGQEAYTAAKYDVAIRELKKAHLLKRIPAILVNIGMTYRKTKDYEMSIYFYRKFLAEAPPDDKQRAHVETEITEVEAERLAASQPQQLEPAKPAVEMAKPAIEAAKPVTQPAPGDAAGKLGAAAKPAGPAGAPGDAAKPAGAPTGDATAAAAPEAAADKPASEWAHTPIDAVPPGKPVDVRVQMPVMKGVKVKVFYRKEGQATFESTELKRRGNEKFARLPESIASGRTFQYYLEARDGAGTLVKNSGSEFSPNIVLIDETARPQLVDASGAAETSDEDEPARRVKAGPKRDIENEAVSFDLTVQQQAMNKLRAQLNNADSKKAQSKAFFGPLGYAGIAVAAAGIAGMAAGGGLLYMAGNYADIVTMDSQCNNAKMRCYTYGTNDNPEMFTAKPQNPPTSYYDQRGQFFDKTGTAIMAVGGVLLAGGGALLAVDQIRRYQKEHPAAPAKKRKVKKVIEVEEPAASLLPMVGPNGVALVGEFHF